MAHESEPARPRAVVREVAAGGADPGRLAVAGIVAEQGLAPQETVARWQGAAARGEFDPEACAHELLEAAGEPLPPRVAQRAAKLLLDLLMSVGASPARRRATRRVKSGVALLLAQTYLLLVWGGILLAAVLLLRLRGVAFDPLLDRLLSAFD